MARDTFYAESTGSSTKTTTSYDDKVSLTLTAAQQTASTDYYVIASCIVRNQTNTTADVRVRLRDDTAASTTGEAQYEMQDATNYQPAMFLAKFTSAGTPVDQTWSLEYAAETSGNTVEIRQAAICVFKKHADDQYAESLGSSTDNTTGTLTDKTTLTFTPGTEGDYIMIAMAEHQVDATGPNTRCVLEVDTVVQADESRTPQDLLNWHSWAALYVANLTAVSHDIKIRFTVETGGANTSTIRNARILLMRKDSFPAWAGGAARGRTTTTSTTYQTKASFTTTPVAVTQVLLGCITIDKISTAEDGFSRHYDGTTAFAEQQQEGNSTTANDNEWPHFMVRQFTGSGISTTYSSQFRAETSSATGAYDNEIMLIQVADTPASDTLFAQSVM